MTDSDGELLKDYPKYCYSDKDTYEYVAQIQFNFFSELYWTYSVRRPKSFFKIQNEQ